MEPTANKPDSGYLIINAEKEKMPAGANASLHEPSAKLLSEYHLQMSRLLHRIETAATHYQVLGLKMAATYDDVLRAYYSILNLFYPAHQIRIALDEPTIERLDAAFIKASEAFAVLTNFRKRADYHNTALYKTTDSYLLTSLPPAPLAKSNSLPPATLLRPVTEAPKPVERAATPPPVSSVSQPVANGAALNQTPASQTADPARPALTGVEGQTSKAVYRESANETLDGDRRRMHRLRMALPVSIIGYDRNGEKWEEMTESMDVSQIGVTVWMRQAVRHGQVFYLNLPLPVKLRSHGLSEASYSVYALVRRIDPEQRGTRVVALEFIGEHPPQGYLEKPWATFRGSNWNGIERRRSPRVKRQERVRLEYFDSNARLLSREETLTENVSASGMRVFAKFAPRQFDLVQISCVSRRFESLAVVRNRFVAKDGIERLCIQFLKRDELGSQ